MLFERRKQSRVAQIVWSKIFCLYICPNNAFLVFFNSWINSSFVTSDINTWPFLVAISFIRVNDLRRIEFFEGFVTPDFTSSSFAASKYLFLSDLYISLLVLKISNPWALKICFAVFMVAVDPEHPCSIKKNIFPSAFPVTLLASSAFLTALVSFGFITIDDLRDPSNDFKS